MYIVYYVETKRLPGSLIRSVSSLFYVIHNMNAMPTPGLCCHCLPVIYKCTLNYWTPSAIREFCRIHHCVNPCQRLFPILRHRLCDRRPFIHGLWQRTCSFLTYFLIHRWICRTHTSDYFNACTAYGVHTISNFILFIHSMTQNRFALNGSMNVCVHSLSSDNNDNFRSKP